VTNEQFLKGDFNTNFIDNTPALLKFHKPQDRATKALKFLANNIVNNPSNVQLNDTIVLPPIRVPVVKYGEPIPTGTKDILNRHGVAGVIDFIKKVKRCFSPIQHLEMPTSPFLQRGLEQRIC